MCNTSVTHLLYAETSGTICLTTKEGKYKQKKHEVKFFSSAVTVLQCITDVNGNTIIFAGSRDGVLKVCVTMVTTEIMLLWKQLKCFCHGNN